MKIQGVTADHREVRPGWIFFAIAGSRFDGHERVREALELGAMYCVGERPPESLGFSLADPLYRQVPSSSRALAQAASELHGNPTHTLKVIGITGTSGKTTTTELVRFLLSHAGIRVGAIGTLGVHAGDGWKKGTHTTPDAPALQKCFAELLQKGMTHVVMEVSSHALVQNRVWATAFDAMAFLNLSPEHLDYHRDLEDYFEAKSLLFTEYPRESRLAGKRPTAFVPGFNSWGLRLATKLDPNTAHTLVSLPNDLQMDIEGIAGTFDGIRLHAPVLGSFNAENLATAVSIVRLFGVTEGALQAALGQFTGVPGRLERVRPVRRSHTTHPYPAVWVDYAHKPEALEKVLTLLRDEALPTARSELWVVFGCGGDRDRQKRPVMGRIAATLADHVILTSDNPRSEDPSQILSEILDGIPVSLRSKVQLVVDRADAIGRAISSAQPSDTVLLAGKGHETEQEAAGIRKTFDDRIVACEMLDIGF